MSNLELLESETNRILSGKLFLRAAFHNAQATSTGLSFRHNPRLHWILKQYKELHMALEKGLLRWLRHLLRQVVLHHAISILMIGGPAISPVRYSPGDGNASAGGGYHHGGMHFRVVSPPTADGLLPTLIYYHGGCFVSGGFATMTINCASLHSSVGAG